jgi:hypothetical protein
MANRFHLRFNACFCSALLLISAGSAELARADEPIPAAITTPEANAPQIEHFEYWRARADAARKRVSDAQARVNEANATVRRMRRNNHPRGEARRPLLEEQEQARAALEAATYTLEVELPAEARLGGAQRHWLSER